MERQQLLPVDDEPGSDPGVLLDISLNSTVIANPNLSLEKNQCCLTFFLKPSHSKIGIALFFFILEYVLIFLGNGCKLMEKNHLSNLYFFGEKKNI